MAGSPALSAYGANTSAFGAWVTATGPQIFSGPREIINDAQLTNYRTLGYLMRGQEMSQVLQGGSHIEDTILLSVQAIAHSYLPGATETYTQPQPGTQLKVPWRFFMTHIAWQEEMLLLNAGGDRTPEARYQKYKDLWFKLEQQLYTDNANYWEAVAWGVPDKTKMEAAGGQEPYSIPCFINEFTNGLPSAAHPNGVWTTVEQIDPAVAATANFKPYSRTYSSLTVDTALNFIDSMDDATMSVDFQPPPMNREYYTSPTSTPQFVTFTSKQGVKNARRIYRDSNDRWQDQWDPFGNPVYDRMPIVYVATLDTAAIFPTGAAAALSTELDTAGTTNAGPRYFGVNPKYLKMVWHKDRYLENLGEDHDARQPTTKFINFNTIGNMICTSRRRHFVLYPSADIT